MLQAASDLDAGLLKAHAQKKGRSEERPYLILETYCD
jgi:hypothetical protein